MAAISSEWFHCFASSIQESSVPLTNATYIMICFCILFLVETVITKPRSIWSMYRVRLQHVCVFHMCMSKFQNTEYVALNRTRAAGSFPPGLADVPQQNAEGGSHNIFQNLSLHIQRKRHHIHTTMPLTHLSVCEKRVCEMSVRTQSKD